MSKAAVAQRKRREDPRQRAHDKLIMRLRTETLEQLAKNHPDEFIRLFNEKRLAAGISAYHPGTGTHQRIRAKRRREQLETLAVKDVEPDVKAQEKCRHDQGLKKLPYGVFCAIETCGKRIR